ncbi:glycosyltransferase [Halobaculum sp. CBA1158]|uniref:glycosyltransferase n=1 Tax=Halobaculum sp. CBA1158 TaxID=2904243 RepID=UPI001F3BB709|nr:glycosyltransferase [Halobaculum sp. CBA1158]UIP01000.1 glycosyltransferase [Halobaculum sp. CBA1158]
MFQNNDSVNWAILSDTMVRPLVSVVIPTYNNQSMIAVCLESIYKQTYDNIEIIVVDGGSTDRTVNICNRYEVTVLETDLGRAAARRRGAKQSNGTWLFHVDSDMELSEGVIEECVTAAQQYDALIVPEVNTGKTYWARCTDVDKHISRYNCVGNLRFLSRELYFEVDGHNPELLNREDREFHELVKQTGASIGHTSETITHHLDGMGLLDILRKRLRYIRSLKNFEERSRVHKEKFNREKEVDILGVLLSELRKRPEFMPGFLLLTGVTAVIKRALLLYYRIK